MEKNQSTIIAKTLTKIIENEKKRNVENKDPTNASEEKDKENPNDEKMIFVAYRGKVSVQSLRKINAPSKIVFTLTKLKNSLSCLKPVFNKSFKSGGLYQMKCSRYNLCQTSRFLVYHIKEHKMKGQ